MFIPNTRSRFERFMRGTIGAPYTEELGKYLSCNIKVDGRSLSNFLTLVKRI